VDCWSLPPCTVLTRRAGRGGRTHLTCDMSCCVYDACLVVVKSVLVSATTGSTAACAMNCCIIRSVRVPTFCVSLIYLTGSSP
jgi:hypothetical protein